VMPDLSAALMRSVRADSGKASSSTPIISASAARAAMCTAVLYNTATACSTGHYASSGAAAAQHAARLTRCRELYRVFMGGRQRLWPHMCWLGRVQETASSHELPVTGAHRVCISAGTVALKDCLMLQICQTARLQWKCDPAGQAGLS